MVSNPDQRDADGDHSGDACDDDDDNDGISEFSWSMLLYIGVDVKMWLRKEALWEA